MFANSSMHLNRISELHYPEKTPKITHLLTNQSHICSTNSLLTSQESEAQLRSPSNSRNPDILHTSKNIQNSKITKNLENSQNSQNVWKPLRNLKFKKNLLNKVAIQTQFKRLNESLKNVPSIREEVPKKGLISKYNYEVLNFDTVTYKF